MGILTNFGNGLVAIGRTLQVRIGAGLAFADGVLIAAGADPATLPAAAPLTGPEVFAVSQGGALVGARIEDLAPLAALVSATETLGPARRVVFVNSASGDVGLTLPAVTTGRPFTFLHLPGSAHGCMLTLTGGDEFLLLDGTTPTSLLLVDLVPRSFVGLVSGGAHNFWVETVPSSGGSLATTTPLAESGSGAAGTSTSAARADHVHPAAGGGASCPLVSTLPTASAHTGELRALTTNGVVYLSDGAAWLPVAVYSDVSPSGAAVEWRLDDATTTIVNTGSAGGAGNLTAGSAVQLGDYRPGGRCIWSPGDTTTNSALSGGAGARPTGGGAVTMALTYERWNTGTGNIAAYRRDSTGSFQVALAIRQVGNQFRVGGTLSNNLTYLEASMASLLTFSDKQPVRYRLVVTMDGRYIRGYVNGRLGGTAEAYSYPGGTLGIDWGNDVGWYLFGSPGSGDNYDLTGRLWDVSCRDGAWSDSDIGADYARSLRLPV